MKICSIHRDPYSVDFVFLEEKTASELRSVVTQLCKTKNAQILMVEWINDKQVVFITEAGLELYSVNARRKVIQFCRNSDVNTQWIVYYPPSQLLICASGITSAVMNPFVIQNGLIHKLNKFEVDFGCSGIKSKLSDKDVMIASIYQKLYLLVLKFDNLGLTKQVNLYEILSDISKQVEISHVLHLNLDENVGLHVIDNLVIVHHRRSAKSQIFDIKLKQSGVTRHYPAVSTPIKVAEKFELIYKEKLFSVFPWYLLIPFQVVDPKEGIFSNLTLILDNVWNFFDDKLLLLRFVMNRTNCEEFMMKVVQKFIFNRELSLKKIAETLQEIYLPEKLNNQESLLSKVDSNKFKLIPEPYSQMKVDQTSIVRSIF
uniref:Uncharacterized protein n=1 Tax=Panagrolaimus sp. JU765 TaxID=591449 RepID=A0AC34Q163_9BILA